MNDRIALVLLQFGGPDSLDAIYPFLLNLFSDPDIITIPFGKLLQPVLARQIAKRRSSTVSEKYAAIGGKSPIIETTFAQRDAISEYFQKNFPAIQVDVFVAMRYWKPNTEEVVQQLKNDGYTKCVLLPLYAQYSSTNAGSSFNEWSRVCNNLDFHPQEKRIQEFFVNEEYLASLNERIEKGLEQFEQPSSVFFLFSAHGIPVSLVERGDPYPQQIRATMECVMRIRNYDHAYSLSYQSKVGPAQWLTPSISETIQKLAAASIRDILVIPHAFVSDHIETLHELEIEEREEAEKLGIKNFVVMPGLNDSPLFIKALANIALPFIQELQNG